MKHSFVHLFLFVLCIQEILCRKHRLVISNDDRKYIALSKFGFYQGGILDIKLEDFQLPINSDSTLLGFTLDRTVNDALNPYVDSHTEICPFVSPFDVVTGSHPAVVYLKLNFTQLRVDVTCGENVGPLHLYPNRSQIPTDLSKKQSFVLLQRRRRDLVKTVLIISDVDAGKEKITKRQFRVMDPSKIIKLALLNTEPKIPALGSGESSANKNPSSCSSTNLSITKYMKYDNSVFYNTSFAMYVATQQEEGFYNLYFHNCHAVPLSFEVEIFESNRDNNFLSAGDLPLPALYAMMSILFFLSACFWCFILRTSRHPVYKIHIIMCVLVYLKSLSLALHGVNYHFIQTKGEHVPAWAILYYITHLLKGAVLFVTLVLVGTGWNFIKYILTDRDKKLFMVVIPLQVVANVAEIILEESEEGAAEHNAWRYIFTLVDLLCCAAILIPVVWSIRHLQDASTTSGKALISLRKLKLFRHFYIMVVSYIYFTRIIAYLLKTTVAFQYSWLDEMFKEMATFAFFVLTGYKFRPASENPYFTATSMDDIEPEVLTESPMFENVSKLSKRGDSSKEDQQPLIQESSHDYD